MKQEIEIEFKHILTLDEFQALKHHFQLDEQSFFSQCNYYFDTKEMSLKSQHSALRIREKNDTYTLTLKQPLKTGLLESHQPLTKEEALNIINGKVSITGKMKDLLQEANVSTDDLLMFGSLSTNRAEFAYKEGLLVLDHSYYFDCDDYEVEYEVSNEQKGQKDFQELLKQFNIPPRKTENKIKRFYNEKKRREV